VLRKATINLRLVKCKHAMGLKSLEIRLALTCMQWRVANYEIHFAFKFRANGELQPRFNYTTYSYIPWLLTSLGAYAFAHTLAYLVSSQHTVPVCLHFYTYVNRNAIPVCKKNSTILLYYFYSL
jgi:hypothetical protein